MNKIPSFTINHNKLLRGIYVSRKDEVGGETVTTFDIRMKVPNQEPCLHNGAIHTIEHLAATYLRNDEEWKDRIIYWGPMGCLTGNYLLIRGDLESKDIVELMKRTLSSLPTLRERFPVRLQKTAATICSTTFLWQNMSQGNTCWKYSTASRKKTSFILLRNKHFHWAQPFQRTMSRLLVL